MIHMNFRYFIHELCNLKENYAFAEEKILDHKLFHHHHLYADTSGQNVPDIPYTNELSVYLSDYYWKLSFVEYVQD